MVFGYNYIFWNPISELVRPKTECRRPHSILGHTFHPAGLAEEHCAAIVCHGITSHQEANGAPKPFHLQRVASLQVGSRTGWPHFWDQPCGSDPHSPEGKPAFSTELQVSRMHCTIHPLISTITNPPARANVLGWIHSDSPGFFCGMRWFSYWFSSTNRVAFHFQVSLSECSSLLMDNTTSTERN